MLLPPTSFTLLVSSGLVLCSLLTLTGSKETQKLRFSHLPSPSLSNVISYSISFVTKVLFTVSRVLIGIPEVFPHCPIGSSPVSPSWKRSQAYGYVISVAGPLKNSTPTPKRPSALGDLAAPDFGPAWESVSGSWCHRVSFHSNTRACGRSSQVKIWHSKKSEHHRWRRLDERFACGKHPTSWRFPLSPFRPAFPSLSRDVFRGLSRRL